MIYLDNAATTFPKPNSVIYAANKAMKTGANPGRGGYKMAVRATEVVFEARENLANFFGINNPENVILTPGCTWSLNIVLKGLLKNGDHVLISGYEHNAVSRPLEKLGRRGVTYTVVDVVEGDDDATLNNFRAAIKENTKLIVCTCASNVFGLLIPFERICALCHQYGILTCVDAAQGAGVIPIDLSRSSIDFLCVAGHKGLYGVMGTGALLINCDTVPDSLIEGGTGSASISLSQPEILPDKFESGTNNFSGIAGLSMGVSFVRGMSVRSIYSHEISLVQKAYENLSEMKNIILYSNYPETGCYAPVLSFNVNGLDCETVSETLSDRYNIAVRSGLHCAPLAHKSKNTLDIGTVRISPSIFTNIRDINIFISSVYNLK